MASGYYQFEIAEEDRDITAFVTNYGLFSFRIMPFGLFNNNNNIQNLYSALSCFTLKGCCEWYKINSDFINLGFINETCLQYTKAHMY